MATHLLKKEMNMKIKNLIWADAEQKIIDCEIEHPAFGLIPFTASPQDVEAHGREIFKRIVAGEFGPVADYVPPPPPPKPVAEPVVEPVAETTAAPSVPME